MLILHSMEILWSVRKVLFLSFSFHPSAAAMCTLQSKGVVHRDLKPQNLLLHHSGMTTPSPSQIKVKIGKLCSVFVIAESQNRVICQYHHGKVAAHKAHCSCGAKCSLMTTPSPSLNKAVVLFVSHFWVLKQGYLPPSWES